MRRHFCNRKQNGKALKKATAVVLASSLMMSGILPESNVTAAQTKDLEYNMDIDGATINENPVDLYRGLGAVSCNNSSRLLLDYKQENPTQYWEIMKWLFDTEEGCGLSHIKIELGCDRDTSSGAEPTTKRTQDEPANVSRGAGFHFAADAKTINPDITVDLLRWGEPGWITKDKTTAEEIYEARYQWFKETIDAVYDTYGMKIDYVGSFANEKGVSFPTISDAGVVDESAENGLMWTIYLADALENETDERYDYGNIKLVAADETSKCDVAYYMLYDVINASKEDLNAKELKEQELALAFREAVDVIGTHYHTNYDNGKDGLENVANQIALLNETYGKEVWNSEDSSSTTVSMNADNATNLDSAMTGGNGILDIANRFINGYYCSSMTMMEYQPAIAAYYSGAVYFPKQLMAANHPWSGYYTVDASVPMTMHFSQFIKKGWKYIDSGCYGDGDADRPIYNTTRNNLTAMNPETEDYSTVITNDSAYTRTYHITTKNLDSAGKDVAVWETRASGNSASYDENWLKKIDTITPQDNGDGTYTYSITVKAYSIVTLTTTEGQKEYKELASKTSANDTSKDTPLALDYSDDFEYTGYPENYLEDRGGTPRYTCDLNGAFEVVKEENGNHVLMQKMNAANETVGWLSKSTDYFTSLGDDAWANYTTSVDVKFDTTAQKPSDNYVELVARYSTNSTANGYNLKLSQDGVWKLSSAEKSYAFGTITDLKEWNTLSLTVNGTNISASINGVEVASAQAAAKISMSGRVGLGSADYLNCFDNLKVNKIVGTAPYVTRLDDLSSKLAFSENWVRTAGESYNYYDRTMSYNTQPGASMSMTFEGTGVQITGISSEKKVQNAIGSKVSGAAAPVLQFTVDGQAAGNVQTFEANMRQTVAVVSGLSYGTHTLTMTVASGNLVLDTVDVAGVVEAGQQQVQNTPAPPTPTGGTVTETVEAVTINGSVYKIADSQKNTVTLQKVKNSLKKKSKIVIPATVKIQGKKYKVTEIAAKAFMNCKKLKQVVIGKNVKKIGNQAFYGCSKLSKIQFKGTAITKIGKNAMKKTSAKIKVTAPAKKKTVYCKLIKKAGAKKVK